MTSVASAARADGVAPRRRTPQWADAVPVPDEVVSPLVRALNLPPDLCRILVRRGYDDEAAVRAFLRPSLYSLHPAGRLPDIEMAAERIDAAIAGGETILVHGDFDADGMSAAALLARGLEMLGANVEAFVPHRMEDGYDLAAAGLERAREVGARLIVTADCGILAFDAVRAAAGAGIDVVVTDHHRPGPRLPDAVAVVNPNRADSEYPFRDLSGVGVVFKVLTALFQGTGRSPEELNEHLDLVALGTIADQMPLAGENRILVRAGLRVLARTRKPGLRALLDAAAGAHPPGLDIQASHVAFRLAPRLNSVGRMAAAADGLRLLLTTDPDQARLLALHLEEQNGLRRQADRDVWAAAEVLLERRFDAARDHAVVLWADGWHPGVIGIAASRVVERLHRPAVLITFDGEHGRGSGRSIAAFHLCDALEQCGDLLDRFGGHAMAAGMSIRRQRVEEFAIRLQEIAARELSVDGLVEELSIDLEVPLERVGGELYRWLAHLGPFGEGNPTPVLATRAVRLERVRQVGAGGRHLRAALKGPDGAVLPAIGFGMGERAPEIGAGDAWDVAFELSVNRWRGREALQAHVRDIRSATV